MHSDDGAGYWPAGRGLSPKIEQFLMPRARPPTGDAVICGMKAGAAGSLIATVMLNLISASSGGGEATMPVRILALRLLGDAYLASGALGIVAGGLACLVAGAAFGALFGLIMSKLIGRVGAFTAAGVGTIYGILLWIVIQYVVVAYAAPDLLILYDQRALVLPFGVYGVCLGLLGRSYRALHRPE